MREIAVLGRYVDIYWYVVGRLYRTTSTLPSMGSGWLCQRANIIGSLNSPNQCAACHTSCLLYFVLLS